MARIPKNVSTLWKTSALDDNLRGIERQLECMIFFDNRDANERLRRDLASVSGGRGAESLCACSGVAISGGME
jgi:hypothetical protein